MKKAIVTGANGFVGSAVCRELIRNGVHVTAIVRNEMSSIESLRELENIKIIYLDLANIHQLDNLVEEKDFDCFYHFAWTGSSGPLRGDYSVQISNVEHTCRAVEAAHRLGCKRFVFAASIMEYEIQELMKTSMPIAKNTLYSSAKITAEYMARAVVDSNEMEYVGGIISNIYGPGEKSPRLVNSTIRKLLNGKYCQFSPGNQLYDFIYIDDAACAFYQLGVAALPDTSYYIGSMNPQPLKNFLNAIRDEVAPGTQIGLGELPFNGVSLSYEEFDVGRLKADTGFVPKIDFREGIRRTAEWIKEQ